ncbi:MAG: macro domain-containing protein [Gammaproteobacteria bacterium]|nr:macro domain-containing protein [Gammaproteobacteria bacterium]
MLAECCALGGRDTGDAKMTGGYRLPAAHVIHNVGPVGSGGDADEDRLLARCYRRSLEVAVANGVRTIAFPAISTGVYGFPVDRAAKIAVRTIASFLSTLRGIAKVVFCCFSEESAEAHWAALDGVRLVACDILMNLHLSAHTSDSRKTLRCRCSTPPSRLGASISSTSSTPSARNA